MIVKNRITTYLHSLETGNSRFLEELRAFAEKTGVPIIRREMESFLMVLLRMHRPKKILEIGAGIAYSAIFMAKNSDADIVTIENYEKRIGPARENIKKAGMEDRIFLMEADALAALKELASSRKEGFDMVFLDAAKAQYIEMLPDILTLLRPGGLLLADNVLQEGNLVESRFVTERRQRTIHERMREFLWEVKHHERLDTSIITIGDGVSLSVKKDEKE